MKRATYPVAARLHTAKTVKRLRAEVKRLRAVRVAAERFMRSLGVEIEGPAQAELRSAIWWSKKPLKKGTR